MWLHDLYKEFNSIDSHGNCKCHLQLETYNCISNHGCHALA